MSVERCNTRAGSPPSTTNLRSSCNSGWFSAIHRSSVLSLVLQKFEAKPTWFARSEIVWCFVFARKATHHITSTSSQLRTPLIVHVTHLFLAVSWCPALCSFVHVRRPRTLVRCQGVPCLDARSLLCLCNPRAGIHILYLSGPSMYYEIIIVALQ